MEGRMTWEKCVNDDMKLLGQHSAVGMGNI